jgi:hypothetical protein
VISSLLGYGQSFQEVSMSSEEMGAVVIVAGWGLMLLAAVRAFGVRRVFLAIGLVVLLAVTVAFKSFGAVTGSRRY